MGFRLTIETDNAAFEDENLLPEVGSILKQTAKRLERIHEAGMRSGSGKVLDSNGNTVGTWELEEGLPPGGASITRDPEPAF